MDFKFPVTNLDWLPGRTIFLTKHGSRAYGTSTPTSDTDYKGVCVPPAKYFHGYLERFEQAESHDPDLVVYSVTKFFRLAADCNPSIIEVLYTEPEDHLVKTELGQRLLEHRDLFLSKKAKHTFSGYAISQLRKLMRSKERPLERINPERQAAVAAFGYDTKDAMHTVRLLKMGLEILRGQGVIVRRPDAQELLAIRDGAWSLDEVLRWANDAETELDHLYETSTAIPGAPDRVRLDRLCQELVEEALRGDTL
jgi:uncharacterized protein